jgi:hypothetical protein
MQGSSVLGKIALISGRYWDDIDPNDNSGMKKFSHRGISTKYQYLPGSTILIPVRYVHFTYVPVQYWFSLQISYIMG